MFFSKEKCIFVIVERYNVVICVISTLVFGAPLPTFYQFALGWVSINNLFKSIIGGHNMIRHNDNQGTFARKGFITMLAGVSGVTCQGEVSNSEDVV